MKWGIGCLTPFRAVGGFWRVVVGGFDAPDAPVALVSGGQKLGDVSGSIARGAISEIHGRRYIRPTTAFASRPGALSGSVNRYSAEFESVQAAGHG